MKKCFHVEFNEPVITKNERIWFIKVVTDSYYSAEQKALEWVSEMTSNTPVITEDGDLNMKETEIKVVRITVESNVIF